jgi:hypothetical protein
MRDDLTAPNIGQAPRTYDATFYWKSYRILEQTLARLLSKGPIRVSELAADEVVTDKIILGTVMWTSGTGTPEGNVVANVGSLYTRRDGGVSTTLYVKQSGTGNTGWAAK